MALGPRLDLRQSQALVMTPQLQQAIKLLQMTNLELNTYVDQELEQNPLLERDDAEGAQDDAAEPSCARRPKSSPTRTSAVFTWVKGSACRYWV